MKTEAPYDLIAKFLAGESTADENTQLENWKNAEASNALLFEEMKNTWQEVTPMPFEPDVEAALGKVTSRLGRQKRIILGRKSFWMSLAASILIVAGLFGLIRTVVLKPKLQTIETLAEARPKEVLLPDGSKVILNHDSKLIFPAKFKGSSRKISFRGEAYFVITPDKARPFIIESGDIITKVVGTEFNLSAQGIDSVVRITVTKGLVSLAIKEKEETQENLIAAGEVGEINPQNGQLKKFENTNPNFMAWRNGILSFENQKLGDAIKTIQEYYNISVNFAPGLDTIKFAATFDSLSLNQVIESMQIILDVDIALEKGVYVLKQKS